MEFPSLGKNCFKKTCNRLDFLPVQCDSCDKVFCSDHFSYSNHSCPGAYKNDIQVPVCPLCGEPVPAPRGVTPDQIVGQHMDRYCKSDTKKIFTNRCSYKNCKRKELVPVTCSSCKLNFCLRHRHTIDHECGSLPNMRILAANAADRRMKNKSEVNRTSSEEVNQAQNIQGNMTEDEALAHALALSIMEFDEGRDGTQRTVQQGSEVMVGGQRHTKDKCSLS